MGDRESDLVRFAKLVKLMRAMQKRYFDGERTATVVSQARDLERRVDKAVAWVIKRHEPRLFPGDDPGPTPGPRA
jgi:hypothetical protein